MMKRLKGLIRGNNAIKKFKKIVNSSPEKRKRRSRERTHKESLEHHEFYPYFPSEETTNCSEFICWIWGEF